MQSRAFNVGVTYAMQVNWKVCIYSHNCCINLLVASGEIGIYDFMALQQHNENSYNRFGQLSTNHEKFIQYKHLLHLCWSQHCTINYCYYSLLLLLLLYTSRSILPYKNNQIRQKLTILYKNSQYYTKTVNNQSMFKSW